MRKLNCFYPGVTQLLTNEGFDSKKVLDAVNAWVGEIKEEDMDVDVTDKSDIKGKRGKTEDKREIKVAQSEKRVSLQKLSGPGLLWALNSQLNRLADRFECGIAVSSFPSETYEWLDRPSFKLPAVVGCKTEAEAKATVS